MVVVVVGCLMGRLLNYFSNRQLACDLVHALLYLLAKPFGMNLNCSFLSSCCKLWNNDAASVSQITIWLKYLGFSVFKSAWQINVLPSSQAWNIVQLLNVRMSEIPALRLINPGNGFKQVYVSKYYRNMCCTGTSVRHGMCWFDILPESHIKAMACTNGN